MTDEHSRLEVAVWRGDRTGGAYRRYSVPRRTSQTVLDVVSHIQRHLDPDLGYRFACRVGMCGSCAMTVNGRPRWTCRTHVEKVARRGELTIEPLRNLPVIRDLICDLGPFFDKWTAAGGHFVATRTRADGIAAINPASASRRAADAGIECINCAVCYAACDVVAAQPAYLGPAALNRAWTLHNDVRDGDRAGRLTAVSGQGGCQNCHSQQGCSEHCPNGLNPTAGIAGLKRASLRALLKGAL